MSETNEPSSAAPWRADRRQIKLGPIDARALAMPKIDRISMAPSRIDTHPLRRLWRRLLGANDKAQDPLRAARQNADGAPWRRAARRRRVVVALLVVLQTAIAAWSLARTFPGPTLSNLEIAILADFSVLFAWISFSFWTSLAAFVTLWRKSRRFSLSAELPGKPLRSRTAVLMPICNEDAARCFAGIEAIYRSLAKTGELEKFDFYVLSDSAAGPRQAREEIAWAETCRTLGGFGKIFYRHRRNNIKKKSGNIADFLRRWGRRYDFMIVLDADSLMAGDTLVRLARLMENHPQVGIIQTAPALVHSDSLFARVQQFANRVYGPLFNAGLRFWQLGESYYWGHNAIVRVAPFIRYCGLARLPGEPPLGGEILSHDFVEAALMGRAGYEVWLADQLPGSYEESPPTLLDELKRDRRWCQGNLQHLRLLLADGFRFGHRACMLIGVLSYASAFLWFIFLVLVSAEAAVGILIPPDYFPPNRSLFPFWPVWRPELAVALLTATGLLLILPKILSLALIVKDRLAAGFGGSVRLAAGIVTEVFISTLLAPIRMWFHSKFVLLTLLGRRIKWGTQRRSAAEVGWLEAFTQHGVSSVFALLWIGGAYCLDQALVWWLLPVCVPLILSAPIAVFSSRASLGRALRDWQWLLVPEERAPAEVLKDWRAALEARQGMADQYQRSEEDRWVERQERFGFLSEPARLAAQDSFDRGP